METKNILVVDDEPVNIKILKAMLSSESFNVIQSSSGSETLKLIEQDLPDLILLDVMMPDMDGFEVCSIIKSQQDMRRVPILMVTALRDKIHRQKAMEAGADDFLSKPIDRIELLIRVKSLLRIKQYSDEQLEHLKILQQKNQKLKELERIKDGLTQMIIHDLRGPLTSISMNIELCLMKLEEDLPIRKYLENTGNLCLYLNEMIGGLLDVHRMEKGQLKLEIGPIDPKELVSDALEQFKPQLEAKQIDLSLAIAGDTPPFDADYRLIKRVIGNLLDNAIRHTPVQGKIVVYAGPDQVQKRIMIKVSDNGRGIEKKYRAKIFDKFEQVKLKKEGISTGSAGLGLAFCKMAVEMHGGDIIVGEGIGGRGCSFSCILPIRPDLNQVTVDH